MAAKQSTVREMVSDFLEEERAGERPRLLTGRDDWTGEVDPEGGTLTAWTKSWREPELEIAVYGPGDIRELVEVLDELAAAWDELLAAKEL